MKRTIQLSSGDVKQRDLQMRISFILSPMSRPKSIALALAIAVLAAIAGYFDPHPITINHVGVGDIGPSLVGFSRFLHGESPYGVRGRIGTFAAYPFPTLVIVAPLLLVPLRFVAAAFCGISSFFLAYGIARNDALWRLLLFLSPPYLSAIHSVQWSPLLTAALLLPSLLPLAVVKPQLAIPLAGAGRWTARRVIVAGILVLLSFAIYPMWLAGWLRQGALGGYNGLPPILTWIGVLILLAALAWRTRDGRLLLGMAVVPQRYFYDQLLLFVLPRSWQQMAILMTTSWIAAGVAVARHWWDPQSGSQNASAWTAVILGIYLPALTIVLWNWQSDRRGATSSYREGSKSRDR